MKLHPRTLPVQKASIEIRTALDRMQEYHDLTDLEMLRVLIEHQQNLTKYMLRIEPPRGRGSEGGRGRTRVVGGFLHVPAGSRQVCDILVRTSGRRSVVLVGATVH